MARGQQKIQSQQKNAEKRAKQKKGASQLKAADKALVYSCTVCLVSSFIYFLLMLIYFIVHCKTEMFITLYRCHDLMSMILLKFSPMVD